MPTDMVALLTCEGDSGRIAPRALSRRFPAGGERREPCGAILAAGIFPSWLSANATESVSECNREPRTTVASCPTRPVPSFSSAGARLRTGRISPWLHPSNFYITVGTSNLLPRLGLERAATQARQSESSNSYGCLQATGKRQGDRFPWT
jgi:hypothetical protein